MDRAIEVPKDTQEVTIRLSNEVIDKLTMESKMGAVPMNALISAVLTKHTEWDRFTKDVGFASVTKAFLRSVLDHLDDKTITTISVSTCRGAMRDAIIYMNGKLDYPGFIKTLNLWLGAASVPFRHIIDEKGNSSYVVQHQLGQKWSIYFGSVVNAVLNEIGYRTEGQVLTNDSLSFAIVKAR